ncbi:MAG: hypothetical protein JXR59_01135 [Desulfuromonadaceae bacterium]|nr:hypothetical protein [Desulfuromonadaceae bacterium]
MKRGKGQGGRLADDACAVFGDVSAAVAVVARVNGMIGVDAGMDEEGAHALASFVHGVVFSHRGVASS